jgi:hypothetical protein
VIDFIDKSGDGSARTFLLASFSRARANKTSYNHYRDRLEYKEPCGPMGVNPLILLRLSRVLSPRDRTFCGPVRTRCQFERLSAFTLITKAKAMANKKARLDGWRVERIRLGL